MLAVGDEPLHHRVAAEQRLPRQQEVEGAAQGIDVGTVVGTPGVQRLLGSHVVHGAENASGLRQVVGGFVGRLEAGDPQVKYLDGAVVVEDQVRRLDVAVDDALGMGVFQTAGRLNGSVHGLLDWHADRAP